MKIKNKITGRRIIQNRLLVILIGIYTVLFLTITFLACFFSYSQKKEELISQIERPLMQISEDYQHIIDNFWQLYMPLFESKNSAYDIWHTYFSQSTPQNLTPFEKKELTTSLEHLFALDNNVQWIVLYNGKRNDNYILLRNNSSVELLEPDFAYLDILNNTSQKMHICGTRQVTTKRTYLTDTYAICGSIPANIGKGKILAGYSNISMDTLCRTNTTTLQSLNYALYNNGETIFNYHNLYQDTSPDWTKEPFSGIVASPNGEKIFVSSQTCGLNTSILCYTVSWQELFFYYHQNTPLLILLFLLFALISVSGYITMSFLLRKEVAVINDGLNILGENNLDYQIPEVFYQSGLSEIASSINHMAKRLKYNINQVYYFELKKREAELSELQAKFNPHFLYNTLEMIRARCLLNQDEATAELISQLSMIFRGFIGSKTIIPLAEELTFSKRYLSLFGARYEDMIEVHYDFDKELLQYGVIRNLFQPLIENYFIHGFDTSNEKNYILFKGKSLDEKTMLLTVQDNGIGMDREKIKQLNEHLHKPIQIDTESYGLKNLHQRLHLFYGENCGLTIYPNPNSGKGLSIQMTLRKITCQEYENSRKSL